LRTGKTEVERKIKSNRYSTAEGSGTTSTFGRKTGIFESTSDCAFILQSSFAALAQRESWRKDMFDKSPVSAVVPTARQQAMRDWLLRVENSDSYK
jgi:hypothetical protein